MIAVIFEVIPKTSGKEEYFCIAAELKSHLMTIEGFISIERFQSLIEPTKFLSLSFWQDEASVKQWRQYFLHKEAQDRGKKELFQHYRIRVAQVSRDYSIRDRQQALINAG
ncbi:antibiotic biosynthesis monooxygenase family protein [Shewanella surugensis]|uniref:Antibiotic biosynthesis monooxygenase n=1 Tax=Shewanella surugensis TaxID=212020 RepID=A0ABT0L8R4_9GAMM|nr:antibiotic biosynthesis monooxygenase [Shewanella surugensis]MCL1124079.1 antibiotic biosynthesis monooxygenase [Shewanella surugensis]